MNHKNYIKRCYDLAIQAGKKGFDTFGALLVHNGEVLETAENTADYQRRLFGHAEFNLVHQCANKSTPAAPRVSVAWLPSRHWAFARSCMAYPTRSSRS